MGCTNSQSNDVAKKPAAGPLKRPSGTRRIDDTTFVPKDLFEDFLRAGEHARHRGQHVEAIDWKGRRSLQLRNLHAATPAQAFDSFSGQTLYLPFKCYGKTVLFLQVDGRYLVDNRESQSSDAGVAYRSALCIKSKVNKIAKWGTLVEGAHVSGDWVEVQIPAAWMASSKIHSDMSSSIIRAPVGASIDHMNFDDIRCYD